MSSRTHQRPKGPAESVEVVELRRLRQQHPELATAVDLQIALLDLQRRVEARVPLPACALRPQPGPLTPEPRHALLRFDDLPIEWNDARYLLRATADLLVRAEALDEDAHQRLLALSREGHRLEPLVEAWYTETSSWDRPDDTTSQSSDLAAFHELFAVALRPFLTRCAHALAPQLDLSGWTDSRCPLCGGEPELAVFTTTGERLLVCGRCGLRWPTPHDACPFCGNADRERLKSFAGPDGRYRLDACDVCLRYVKAYDERHAPRPALPPVDTIATLPLDAAALQQGYQA